MTPRPFRALRYDPARVDLALVLGSGGADPRHVERLVDERTEPGDGKDAPLRRARLRLAEWRRAGVLRRDETPALYLVRRRSERDGAEHVGLFCALSVDGVEPGAPGPLARGVAVAPVVGSFVDDSGRIRRTLESAADREADAAWRDGEDGYELFVVDDESTTARVATLLGGGISVERGAELLAAHAALKARSGGDDDEGVRADAHALAFVHPAGELWERAPVGVALLVLGGAL
jgi:hypothetical protein